MILLRVARARMNVVLEFGKVGEKREPNRFAPTQQKTTPHRPASFQQQTNRTRCAAVSRKRLSSPFGRCSASGSASIQHHFSHRTTSHNFKAIPSTSLKAEAPAAAQERCVLFTRTHTHIHITKTNESSWVNTLGLFFVLCTLNYDALVWLGGLLVICLNLTYHVVI